MLCISAVAPIILALPTCRLNPFFGESAVSIRTVATGGRPGTRIRQARVLLALLGGLCLSREFSIKSPCRTPPILASLSPAQAHCQQSSCEHFRSSRERSTKESKRQIPLTTISLGPTLPDRDIILIEVSPSCLVCPREHVKL